MLWLVRVPLLQGAVIGMVKKPATRR